MTILVLGNENDVSILQVTRGGREAKQREEKQRGFQSHKSNIGMHQPVMIVGETTIRISMILRTKI